MKKKKLMSILIIASMAASFCIGCGGKSASVAEAGNQSESKYTEEDIKELISGIENHYVLQNAKNVDYMYGVEVSDKADMADIIKDIKVDASKVKEKNTGTYTITYTVTAYEEKLESYLEKQSSAENLADSSAAEGEEEKQEENAETVTDNRDESDKAEDTGESSNDGSGQQTEDKADKNDSADKQETGNQQESENTDSETGENQESDTGKDGTASDVDKSEEDNASDSDSSDTTVDIEIDKEVTVVDEEKAEDLVEEGETVWTDNNESFGEEDGKNEEKEEEGDKGDGSSESGKEDSDKEEPDSKPDTEKGSSSSGSASSGAGNGGNSSPGNSHTHNWVRQTKQVYHEATGHNEWVQDSAAWDEPVYENRTICNYCGADITGNTDHIVWCGPNGEGASYSVRPVQTGTIHHEATGHYEWVQDSTAWTETVDAGYDKCSICGATR